MILDFLNKFLQETKSDVILPELKVREIAGIVNTREDGTLLEDVKNINQNKAILKAIPSIEFETCVLCKFSEIEDEINNHRPVIAWLAIPTNGTLFKHSVVVTCVDMENHLIYYNDPIFGKKRENIGSFMSMWENLDKILIKVKIGKREQRLLDEWLRIKETQESEGIQK